MRTLAVLAIVFSASIAAAQAPGQTVPLETEQPPLPTMQVSYSRHVMLADAASLALVVAGPMISRNAELSGVGLAGYFLAAPLVHVAHGRGRAAAKSLALRVGLPIAGGLLGYHIGPNDTACEGAPSPDSTGHAHGCGNGSIVGTLLGALGGGVAAMAIDARVLANYKAAAPPTWSASVRRTSDSVMVGIGRAF